MRENLPRLRFSLTDAQRLVDERIEIGQQLLITKIPDNEASLDSLRGKYYSWDEYNCDLLQRLIGGDKFVREYVPQIVFGGGSSSLSERIQEFRDDLQGKLRRLESIRERLVLCKPAVPTPVLVIRDEELRRRTADLLDAPNNYDRVIREATTILEYRIRNKVPFDDLAKLIPNAADQTGDELINKLVRPNNPAIVFGDPQTQTRLFRMLGAVVAYLRNPSHHKIDDTVEWSWAWSVVGLIDQLLENISTATYQKPPGLA